MILKNITKKINNKCFLVFLGIGVLFFSFVPFFAFATTLIGNVLLSGFFLFPMIAIVLLIGISWISAAIWGSILNWVTGPTFITLSYTNPANNDVIKIGLDIVQPFVHMLLVMALVYVALSIALQINEQKAKQAFAKIIIVALLVNFAPVFVGLIVDATNIAMNYFLKAIHGAVGGFFSQTMPLISSVMKHMFNLGGNLINRMGALGMGIAAIAFNFAVAFIFMLFTTLFLFRYIAIWILTILSPLAFVCWAMPITQNLWKKWIEQLVQWSIIGIPLAFFLYLGMSSFSLLSRQMQGRLTMTGVEDGAALTGLLDQLFPFGAVLIFLALGLLIGLQTSAMFSGQVINYTKVGGRKLAAWTGKGARTGAGRIPGAREFAEKQASARFMPQKITEMKGWKGAAAKGLYAGLGAPLTVPLYAVRRGIGELGLRWTESQAAETKQAQEKLKGAGVGRKMQAITNPLIGPEKKVGALRQAIEEDQLGDLIKEGLTDDEITKIGREALRINTELFKEIKNAAPHLAQEMGRGFEIPLQIKAGIALDEAEIKKIKDDFQAIGVTLNDQELEREINQEITTKIMMKIKPDFIPKMNKGALLDSRVQTFFHEAARTEQVAALLTSADPEAREKFLDQARRLTWVWYKDNRPELANYFKNSPGIRALGGELPGTPSTP